MVDWRKAAVDMRPQELDYDESKLARVKDHYGNLIESGKIQAASFLLARHGKTFAHEAAGRLTYRLDSPPFQPDSIKRIASITKVITACAVLKLVEDGKIWLEQPVKEVIAEFDNPIHGKITFRHLLTHTSGLPADGGYFLESYPRPWEPMDDASTWFQSLLSGPLQSEPGQQWSYCSRGFSVLAEAVSRVSGVHYNQYVEDHFFSPLGMSRTSLEPDPKLHSEVSLSMDWDAEVLEKSQRRPVIPNGGGGVFSTLKDLFVLGQMTMNGGTWNGIRVLGKKTIQEMTRNQLTGIPAFHWGKKLTNFPHGLGWGFYCDGSMTGPATYNHQGWGHSYLFVDPVEHFILTLFVVDPNEWNPQLLVEPVNILFSGIQ